VIKVRPGEDVMLCWFFTAVDPSTWPEVDSQPLSLEDSWRLRIVSAQMYSIVKNRKMEHFEKVMSFLENSYRLLPRLVAPIKHMKIIFGLKTMVVMWMLREGRGMVDTVFKITKFFPSKLPQYQDQCSQHEMFLMRKNHLDFKSLAQALAMDKVKLQDYIKNQMEKQYGEHYAQKVEDRLLHYLHKLETALPGDTYIDKILKKESPVTEEEKLLLEVITSDSTTIATTLKKLLHCDVASCRQGKVSQSSEHGRNRMKSSQRSKSVLYDDSSKALYKSVETKTPIEFQPEVFRGAEEARENVLKESSHWLENESDSDISRHKQTEEAGDIVKRVKEESNGEEKEEITQRSRDGVPQSTSPPQFCSKHQRWVRSILQECPDECSEELLLQADVSSSPPLFQSSSSTSASQDLTPSDLIPSPPDQQHPHSKTSPHLAAQASEQANPEDKLCTGTPGSESDTPQIKTLPQPIVSRNTPPPTLLSPSVRLVDIACVRGIYPTFKQQQASPNHITMSNNKEAVSTSTPQTSNLRASPHRHTSGNDAIPKGTSKDSIFKQLETVAPTDQLNTMHKVHTAPVSQDASTYTSCQPLTSSSRLSRNFRRARTTTRHSQAVDRFSQNLVAEQFKKVPSRCRIHCPPLPNDLNVSGPPTQDASTSTSQSGISYKVCTANQIPKPAESSPQVVSQNSIKAHSGTHISPFQSKTLSRSTNVRSRSRRVRRAQLKLSLPSQAVLLHSKLLQPFVQLTRLSAQECHRLTNGRSSASYVACVAQGSIDDNDDDRKNREEDSADSSFDLNTLYSSHSSGGDSEDSFDKDPDYKPCIKKKRLLLEYETARCLSHI
ncbi:hypothetical protein L3Q82_024297, partial [Scortum barcoo]